jgi:RimJ/RimL family protein N-acetyltransferase
MNRAILQETDFHIREADEYGGDPQAERRFVEQMAANGDALYLLGLVDDEIAGLLIFQRDRYRRMRHGGSLGLAVRLPYQQRGLGSAMLARFFDWVNSRPGLEKVKLEVFSTNPVAQKIYERLGFVVEGVRRGDVRVQGRAVDLVLMAKYL